MKKEFLLTTFLNGINLFYNFNHSHNVSIHYITLYCHLIRGLKFEVSLSLLITLITAMHCAMFFLVVLSLQVVIKAESNYHKI